MADTPERKTASRRDWLRGAARLGVLGGMGIGAAWLVARGGGGGANTCRWASTCLGCLWQNCCTLPKRPEGDSEERSHE